jgi:preprotein translocase subunit SecD
MNRLPWGRIIFILTIFAICAIVLLFKPIIYGLDLRGGSHLLIRVHADEAVENEVDDAFARVQNAFKENNIDVADSNISIQFNEELLNVETDSFKQLLNIDEDPPYFEITIADSGDRESALKLIQERLNVSNTWSLSTDGNNFRLTLNKPAIEGIRQQTVENVRRSISYRINQLGVAEPNIVIQGDPVRSQRILLQLPGVEDPAEARLRIQTPGNLEYRLVVYDPSGQPYQANTKEELLAQLRDGKVPAGQEAVPLYSRTAMEAKGEVRIPEEWHLLYKDAPVTSSYLVDAQAGTGQTNDWVVHFTLNAEGGDNLRRMTRPNVDKLMAIVLDDESIFVGNIKSELGSEAQIEGGYAKDKAERLAWLLRTGAVPTSMHFEEERSVGPSLGSDIVEMGKAAAMWGIAFVVVFVILYYRLSGLIAVLALALNIVLILAFMAWVGAVLTLPGIAGLILTMGMAVDANVLIYERIREELRIGKTVMSSIEGGFGKAFSTIFDANVTTLIAAVFLFQFGTGPIRGFATTITVGILASMFTAIFVARVIFDSVLALKRNQIKKLSI